jgi:hypothetical protein
MSFNRLKVIRFIQALENHLQFGKMWKFVIINFEIIDKNLQELNDESTKTLFIRHWNICGSSQRPKWSKQDKMNLKSDYL